MIERTENTDGFTAPQRIELLKEMMECGDTIPIWVYGVDFHLKETSSEKLVLSTIFEHTGCLNYMKEHFSRDSMPLVLSSYLGLMWCAARSDTRNEDGAYTTYYVLGPVINVDISLETIREAIKTFNVDMSWRTGFTRLMQSISVVPSTLFFQYALMLHYCAAGEKL